MQVERFHHVAYRCKDAKETVEWYVKHLNMNFVLAIAEDQVPSTHAPDPYMHIFLDAGGGNVLALMCDLTIASRSATFRQVGPAMGSFDAGFGTWYLEEAVGRKKAKEIWFLCRQYSAAEALEMHLVNKVVPLSDLEAEGVQWANEILDMSPTAIRFLKSAFLVATDGLAGLQEFAGHATGLYYTTDEAHEGSTAFLEKRPPTWKGR